MRGRIACCHIKANTQNNQKQWWSFVSRAAEQPLSLVAMNSVPFAAAVRQQRYNGSRVASSCLCASNHGVCVVGAQEEIEPRRYHFHAQCNNQRHIIGPHTTYRMRRMQQEQNKAVAHIIPGTCRWNACVHPFRLARPPRYQVNTIPTRRGTLCVVRHVLPDNPLISCFENMASPLFKRKGPAILFFFWNLCEYVMWHVQHDNPLISFFRNMASPLLERTGRGRKFSVPYY